MVVVDKRRSLIVSTAGHFFGVPVADAANDEAVVDSESVLENFLDRATCRTLCAQPADNEDNEVRLQLTSELPVGRNTLVFFKLKEAAVTEKNFYDLVHVTSTGSGKESTLIEALRQVWAPTFRSSGLSSSYLKKLEENLLGSSITTSVFEEEDHWRKRWEEAKRSHDKTIFAEAVKSLKSIRAELESAAVARNELIAMEDAVEAVSGYVDDLWKLGDPVYSEDRMKSFLDIIGDEVVSLVRNVMEEIRTSDDRAKIEAISIGADVCEKWTNMVDKFTVLFWPHHSLHPWKGPSHIPQRCAIIGERLRQIAELCAQYRQLTRLLTQNERSGLGTDTLLQYFDDVRVVFDDDEKSTDWNRLRRKVEEGLVPAEERVAQKLKSQIADATTPNFLLAEFRRYFELMKREGLKRTLRGERETLLSAYGDLIDNCLAGPDTGDLLDSPKILQEVQAARSAEARLESLDKLGKELLDDLPGYEEVSSKVIRALKDVERKRQSFLETWIEETKAAVARKELSLGTDSAVVELTGTSMMRVTYDPRLMTLIREARALSSQGVELPREVRDLVERAGSLAGRARALQQIATFHNTIGDRMVPSQRPLMLTTALELARAVQEQSGVVWSDPMAVDAYTARLKELVRKFAQQNSDLAAKHCALRDLVSSLLKGETVNLIGNQNAWKDALMNMRTIVDTVEVEYGNTKAWKLHWDRQLLKALGVAYRGALPSLLKKLPDVKAELTFRDGSLQWRPSLEEIRAKLYSSIRRSLSIPMNFRGVGDAVDARFGDLIQRSGYLFGGVYKQAEIALSALETLRTKWLYLAAPAKIDAAECLKGRSPQEWTRAFKDAKQWAQEVGKLRGNEVKIWCISVDTSTTRSDLESASRRYWERLCSDLRVEASSRLVAIVEFLSAASKELERRPRSVEEVGLAYEAHARIERQSSGMADEMEAVAGLSKVLAAWTSEKLEGVSAAYTSWQDLADRLERHKMVVARELEDAKVNLRHRGVALRDEIERWQTKWSSKPEILTLDWIISMRERWTNLKEQLDVLKTDCCRVELNIDELLEDNEETVKNLELQLEVEESNCRFQAEFIEELKNQEDEEWTVARRRLPRLHDWLDSWENRIRVQLKDQLKEDSLEQRDSLEASTYVGRKVRDIRAGIEWLQLLRGDEIAEEHWGELRAVLNLVDVKNVRDITLGHLLRSVQKIEEQSEKIKEIARRAAAESGIRQGLMELESWEASAHFQLQQSKDSKNAGILLVEEYGSLLARSGELRLLLEGAKGAAGYERFAARVARCETGLSEVEERIKTLSTVQRKWVYLEPVYEGGAAPNDTGRWSRANKEFRYLMGEVSRDPRASSLRRLPLSTFTNLKDLLDRCQRSLDEYLEEKRSSYPRLYFLSDEDLLELVSAHGRGLEAHLPKLYQGVGSIIKDDNGLTAVVSPEGEILQLPRPVDLREPLPRWLGNLEDGMKTALQQSLEKCLADSSPDPSSYPTQVLLLAERIRFAERCEKALKEGRSSLKNLVDYLETQRARYRGLEDAGDKLTALKARGLLLDTVHHLGTARNLLNVTVQGESTVWAWRRQLRCYRTSKGPVVRCAAAEFPYRFEYQGAANGLVQTSLTERCFLALAQAMKLGLGGSPTGPAGTGKTESVKALGSILGRLVLVFNCDEGMDAGSMRRILGGLAQAGAWGCFDEFNRLEEETLSAVAMLVRPLQEAVRDGASEVLLADQRVKLDPHCCVFITMNPAGIEYGGRRKLPDSLARLFRPVGMAHPDRSDIVKALLECAGFLDASTLAKQLVETLDIAEILLSSQPHYDWGLRALRSVLDAIPTKTELDETSRLVAAIRASTLPKLTQEDTMKFLSLLEDIFPKANPSSSTFIDRLDLQAVLQQLCAEQELSNEMANRCIQLNDQLKSRTGVVIVGPAGSGKTTIRKLLWEALTKIGETVVEFHVYPGAMPKSRLLGRADIEGELGKVEPLVEQAAHAVAGISADALSEVRSLRAPPAPVRDVLEGVLRLMGIKDTSWNSMKTFLAKRGIKDEIRTWDARRSTTASLEAVAKLVKERPESFEEKTAKRASQAAAPLAAWVLANLQYGQILQQVAPLEKEQRLLAESLSAAEAQIGKLAAGLNSVESRVAQLQEQLAEHSRGAAALQLRAEATEGRLTTARALLQKLDTEHRDWQTQLEELTARKEKLDVEAANVASLLVYENPGRDDKWKKLAIDLLITERERLQWRAQGLPADTGSLVAASCALRGPLVPIFVDPSGVAVAWLKNNIGSRMEVTRPEDGKFLTALELAVRFGKPLLVEELVEFPSILLPLLRRRPLRLGERTLPPPQGFKLFLATRRDRLDGFPKEVDAVLFKIALGASTKSLAERFVERVLLKETPELATKRKEALEREEKLSGERDTARLDLLAQLATARGQDLLQESEGSQGGLLSSLEATQSKAKEIAFALEESRRSLEDVSRRAKDHEKLAKFAASLYKTVRALTALSPLYVFSAEAFTDIYLEAEDYRNSIVSEDKKEQDKLIEKRLISLTLYHCAKAVYRKHRLPLALQLALSLHSVPDVERNFLLGEVLSNDDGDSDYRVPEWVPEERRLSVRALVSALPHVAVKMKPAYLNDVSNIYAETELTTFRKILLIKTLRPDYLHTALTKLAAEVLGVKELAPPPWSLRNVAEEQASYPVLLLLSPGADPGSELQGLANNQVASATGFTEVSLGQGQVAQAELALESVCRNGNWLLLSNLHLALNWLPRLESLLRSPMCTTNKNPSTRIWLTTEECSGFYPSLAGLCTKLAYEAPEGVKRNVKRSLQQLQQRQQDRLNVPGSVLLSWLHATLQERRKFVPEGWIRSYEWNEADIEAAYELVVKEMPSKRDKDNDGFWQTGRGLLDVAIYGGRLQDDYDMRALCSIVRDIWSTEVYEGRRKLAGVLRISGSSFEDALKVLEQVPDTDSPREFFGLPANAHRAWERGAAEAALSRLKGVLLKVSVSDERNHNRKIESKIQRDLKDLMERHSSVFALPPMRSGGIKNPLERFFVDELNLTKKTLNLIRADVDSQRFEDSKTPKCWLDEWKYGPKDVLSFVKGLLARYQTLETMLSISSCVIDMSRLARPRAFFTVLKQHTAKETRQPLENLRLRVNWIEKQRMEEWKISLIIEGLLISGAVIQDGVLKDLDANAASVAAAPSCQIAFLPENYADDKMGTNVMGDYLRNHEEDVLNIPVYASSQRDILICSLPIRCPKEDQDNWLRRGVAFHLKPT
ncbi:dynein cytoplasmic heavy chain beethoven [Augochlora pura]